VITVERVIPAPAGVIFELLADPAQHPVIDGSGSVRKPKASAPGRLSAGSTFGMSMKIGIGYSIANEVIEFEPDRRIAWQAGSPGLVGRFTGGRIWRYELEPVDGGTRVRESWDVSRDHQRPLLKLGGLPERTRRNMERTLERIEAVLAGR